MGVVNKIIKPLTLFSAGAILYMAIEVMFRGYTFWLMGMCGGLAFVTVGALNEYIDWEIPIWIQSLMSGFIITGYELLFGVLFNGNHQMWDYRNIPFNYEGQICILFFFVWCLLGIVGIILDDYLRYWLFGEEKPHYC